MNSPKECEESIFNAALEYPAAARAAYLEQCCGLDADLRRRVERLVEAHERTGGFMAEAAASASRTVISRLPPRENVGERIGRYKLLQQIGEGGCGVVYMAEQEEPVRRRVALKVIKLGMDTKSVIARFEAERQALALMDHPHIARVLDAGATDTGRPFFVMELVRGIKITDFCKENKLSNPERLKLFVPVCQAIQHAHQKGIIHRDIKPSNILVTVNDGAPVPKVIDFGIAKATNQQSLTDRTLFTAFEQFIGTPAYMSPEQAVMTSLDLDTRTDIYSLGVLLYELLTGHTPFDATELLRSGLEAMRQTIRDQEPLKPSARLSTMAAEALTATALSRHTEGQRLIHSVRGDLDWIVMKCLEKDRTRRYDSATGLAADIQKHLASEPVSARPASAWYRLQKLIRRNRLAAAAVTAVSISLLVGLAIALVLLERTRRAEQAARVEAARSQQVARFLAEMLQGVGPSRALGRDTTMLREILEQTSKRLKDLKDQPALEADLRAILGNIYRDLGENTNAIDMHREALLLRQRRLGPAHPDVASSLNDLGEALYQTGELFEARTVLRQGLELRQKIFGDEHPDVATSLGNLGEALMMTPVWRESEPMLRSALAMRRKLFGEENLDVARSYRRLGLYLALSGHPVESEAMQRRALDLSRQLLGQEHPEVADSLSRLAEALTFQRRYPEAEGLAREALALNRKLLPREHPTLALSLNLLADNLHQSGQFEESTALLREAVGLLRRTGDAGKLLPFVFRLGNVLRDEGQLDEAVALFREALALLDQMSPSESGGAGLCIFEDYLVTCNLLAGVLRRQEKTEAVHALYREQNARSLVFHEKRASGESPTAWSNLAWFLGTSDDPGFRDGARALNLAQKAVAATRRKHPDALDTLAGVYAECGRFPEAASAQREVIKLVSALPSEDVNFATQQQEEEMRYRLSLYQSGSVYRENNFMLLHWLTRNLIGQGQIAQAAAVLREQVAHLRAVVSADHPDLAGALVDWAETLLLRGQFEEAESIARESLRVYEARFPDTWWAFHARSVLGGSVLGQKRFAEAETLILSAYDGLKKRERMVPFFFPVGKLPLRDAMARVGDFYEMTQDAPRASDWRRNWTQSFPSVEMGQRRASLKTAASIGTLDASILKN